MPNIVFSERLNKELDSIGAPLLRSERIDVFSKLMKIPKFKAETILDGIVPEAALLTALGTELEVNPEWLAGRSDQKKR